MYNSFIIGTKNLKLGAIKDDDSSKCHMPNIVDMFFHMRLHAASWKNKIAGNKKIN